MTRMKELRKKKGFSQVRMQMLTGIDQSDYSKIETGKRNMSFEQCRRTPPIPEQNKTTAGAVVFSIRSAASEAMPLRYALPKRNHPK